MLPFAIQVPRPATIKAMEELEEGKVSDSKMPKVCTRTSIFE